MPGPPGLLAVQFGQRFALCAPRRPAPANRPVCAQDPRSLVRTRVLDEQGRIEQQLVAAHAAELNERLSACAVEYSQLALPCEQPAASAALARSQALCVQFTALPATAGGVREAERALREMLEVQRASLRSFNEQYGSQGRGWQGDPVEGRGEGLGVKGAGLGTGRGRAWRLLRGHAASLRRDALSRRNS